MRVQEKLESNQSWGLFAGDAPGGGNNIECESCGAVVLSNDEDKLICPNCGKELMYAPWWEW